MPALTIATGPSVPNEGKIANAHQCGMFDDRYKYSLTIAGRAKIAEASYPSYPLREYDCQNVTVVIEGEIYNRTKDEIDNAIEKLFINNIDIDTISDWIKGLDGEFVFYCADRNTGDLTIVPDVLGQLPLFYCKSEDFAAVGRNKIVLAEFADLTDIDKLGVAEYLRIGYTLSPRTLYEDIKRVPPGTIIQVDGKTAKLSLSKHYTFDFSSKQHASRRVSENAQKLATAFEGACKRRAEACPGTNVLLLSGGLDSRSVLAGLDAAGAPYRSITRDNEYTSKVDVELAEEIARTIDAYWDRFPTEHPDGGDLTDHLMMTAGISPFGIAHIQPFFRDIRDEVPESSWIYTGDGGDKILPDLTPIERLNSLEDLIDYILRSEGTFDTEVVQAITNVSEEEIRDDLRSHLQNYPEDDFDTKFVHYEVFQRAFSRFFEGEDLDRYHLWTTTPYYASDVFQYAMEVPDSQKRRYRLYGEFLEELSPPLAAVDRANFGAPPNSWSHMTRVVIYNYLQRHPELFDIVKPIIKKILGYSSETELNPLILQCICEQAAADGQDIVDLKGIEGTVLTDPSSFGRGRTLRLLTLTSFLDLHTKSPILDQYHGESFG